MPVPATADAFLDCVRKSNLVEAERLEAYLRRDDLPGDPNGLAGRMVRDGLLTKFQATNLLAGKYKNFVVGKYKLLEPIGAGGQSRVFLCEHLLMKHRVALKLMPLSAKTDQGALQRFFREARAVAALNHPNVVRAHDLDRHGNQFCYIVMDYVDGVNLQDLVRKVGPLEPERAANYVAQAAVGLQAVADASLVHRDIKPGNLLIDRTGVVRVLDLGLARFSNDDADSLTENFDNNAVLGTADYIAPEQALKTHSADIRSDIYSLGATLYYLLSGRAPFQGEPVTHKLLAHQMREPPPLPSAVPRVMAEIVATMMAKKPEDRYQTPAEVAEALSPWANRPFEPIPDEEFPQRGLSAGPASLTRTGAADTVNASQRYNTPPASTRITVPPSSRRVPKPEADAGPPKKSGLSLIVGVAAGGLAAALGLFLATRKGGEADKPADQAAVQPVKSSKPAAPAAPIPDTALVVTAAKRDGAFPSVAAALAKAKPGDRVVVADPAHREQLAATDVPKGVTVESWGTEPVRWQAPADRQAGAPLLDLRNCDGLKVKGFVFDGQNQTDTLVRLSGDCPGLTLESVELLNFNRAAVSAVGCSGEPGRPVTLTRVRAAAGKDVPAGLELVGPTGAADDFAARHLLVEWGRFEGSQQAAVRVGAAVIDFEVRHTRFHRAVDGVLYAPAAGRPALGLKLVGNTFADVQRGVRLTAPPAAGGPLVVTNNLFVQTPRLMQLDGLRLAPEDPPAVWVWADEGKKTSVIPQTSRYFRRTFDVKAVPAKAVLDLGGDDSFAVWLNGRQVGESSRPHFTQRVYTFDVTKLLRPGKNVLAVKVTNLLDQVNPSFATAAGLLALVSDRSAAKPKTLCATDESWKAAPAPADGWEGADFDDGEWKNAAPWQGNAVVWPWLHAVWDSAVAADLQAKGWQPVAVEAAGNVRDYKSWEGYPLVESARGVLEARDFRFASDNTNDDVFLRYPAGHALARAGADNRPVGVPPAE